MAIFVNENELQKQQKFREFQGGQYGDSIGGQLKKAGLEILGVDPVTGKSNTFGKYLGHGNVLMDHYLPSMLAEGDAKTVIDENEGAAWNKQFASFEAAKDIVGVVQSFGGGGGMMNGNVSAGQGGMGGSSGGGMASMFGQGGGGATGEGTMMGNTMNQMLGGEGGSNSLQSQSSNLFKTGTEGAQTELDEAVASKSSQQILASDDDDDDMISEEDYQTYADAMAGSGGPQSAKYGKGVQTQSTEDWEQVSGMVEGLPIVGEALGSIIGSQQAKWQYADDKQATMKGMLAQTINPAYQNYL